MCSNVCLTCLNMRSGKRAVLPCGSILLHSAHAIRRAALIRRKSATSCRAYFAKSRGQTRFFGEDGDADGIKEQSGRTGKRKKGKRKEWEMGKNRTRDQERTEAGKGRRTGKRTVTGKRIGARAAAGKRIEARTAARKKEQGREAE